MVTSGTGRAARTDALDVMAEIRERTAAMRSAALARGRSLLPPLLMLGTSERVGSNWLSDTLRSVMDQHNEPFRQQPDAGHPLSALNPQAVPVEEVTGALLGTYGRHWLVTFVTSKYGTTRQGVKETNLFFALSALLALFPDSPVAVLSRSPVGVVSSFMRSGLFTRWDYRSRYRQMVSMTQSGRHRRYTVLVPDDDPPGIVALTRLQVLNTVLIAAALDGRDAVHIPYEAAVRSRDQVVASLARAVPELAGRLGMTRKVPPGLSSPPGPADQGAGIYSTVRAKEELVAYLTEAEAAGVNEATAATLAAVASVVPAPVAGRAAAWLGGSQHYQLATAIQPVTRAPAPSRQPPTQGRPGYIRRGQLKWRNLLVTNAEFAAMLNELGRAGLVSSHAGAPLLACQMPHQRGGRLHYDPGAGRWRISDGYEMHPVYWVTWIGAAAFAAWDGARLPRRAELAELTARRTDPVPNAGYRFTDVTPVLEPGLGDGEIHHLVGNLQVWCSDGPGIGDLCEGPAARWMHGAAWNTPGTAEAIHQPRWRHLAGSSRGVGIRLVRDGAQRPLAAGEIARRLLAWVSGLADRSGPLAESDEQLIQVLGSSQPDAGLGTHVAAGPGETRHG